MYKSKDFIFTVGKKWMEHNFSVWNYNFCLNVCPYVQWLWKLIQWLVRDWNVWQDYSSFVNEIKDDKMVYITCASFELLEVSKPKMHQETSIYKTLPCHVWERLFWRKIFGGQKWGKCVWQRSVCIMTCSAKNEWKSSTSHQKRSDWGPKCRGNKLPNLSLNV